MRGGNLRFPACGLTFLIPSVFYLCNAQPLAYVDSLQHDSSCNNDQQYRRDRNACVEDGGRSYVQRRTEHGRGPGDEAKEGEELPAAPLRCYLGKKTPGQRLAAPDYYANGEAKEQPLVADFKAKGGPERASDNRRPPVYEAPAQ